MKFFKHFTDSHRGRSMQAILGELGHTGHSVWWLLVEICADKMNKHVDEEYSDAHCKFVFNERFLRNNLRLSHAKLTRILHQYEGLALLSVQITESEIHIHMPKLLECLDRDTRRARHLRDTAAPKRKRKKENKKEREIDAAAPLPPLALLWNEHCGKLAKVEKTNKARNQKAFIRFTENSAPEWVEIIKRIAASDFCNGKSDRGWVATFDWLLQPETHLKIAEGKYDNRDGPSDPGRLSDERIKQILEGA